MTTVGFDFGNMNCVIARCGRGGVDVLLNGASQRQNACVVSMQGKQRFMGDEAAAIQKSNFKNTPLNIKRLLGRQFQEPEIQEEINNMPGVKFLELEDGTVGVELSYNDEPTVLSMEQCVAMMLTKLIGITLEATEAKPGDCVISIPGYYTDAQRQAMLNACEIAQLNCLRLLHEGTAVALEYGMFKSAKGIFDHEKPQHVLFLDYGHGSFSATVASFLTGKLAIKSAAYDRTLGGRDFDTVIAKKIAEAFKAKHKDDPWENPKAQMKLLTAAEKAKKTLSPAGVTEARISCECLMNDIDFNLTIKLDEFVLECEPLLARLEPVIAAAIAESGIAPADIGTVEIVGGSTRLGFVKSRMAKSLIGLGLTEIDTDKVNSGLGTTMNADEAVCRGTAWQAALLSTRFRVKEFQVLDAVAFPVKLQWEAAADGGAAPAADDADKDDADAAPAAGATSALLFKKNEATPNAKKVTFRRNANFTVTAAYDDAAMPLLPEGTKPVISAFTVETPTDLAATSAADGAMPKIRVNVKHNIHGIVSVSSAQLMEEIKEKPVEASAAGEEKMDIEAKDSTAAEGESKDEAAAPDAAKDEAPKDEVAKEVAAEEPPKKKRFKKVELSVSSAPMGMSKARVASAVEFEVKMAHQDKVVVETKGAANDVESYIYSQRDAIVGPLASYFTAAEKEDQEKALTDAEDWLYYGDGYDSQKSVYVEKLADLKKRGANAEFRSVQARNRDGIVQTLKASLEEYKKWLHLADGEKFVHILDEEKSTVRVACDECETWLYAQLEAQGKLEANQDPAFTMEDIGEKRRGLVDTCKKIVNKPKPKPKVEAKPETPDAEAKPEGDDPAPATEPTPEGKEGDDAKPEGSDDAKPEDAPAEAEAKPEEPAAMSDDK